MNRLARAAAVAALVGAAAGACAAGYALADIGGMDCATANTHLDKGIAAGDPQAAYAAAQRVIRRVCFKRDMAAYQKLLRIAASSDPSRSSELDARLPH